MYLSIQHSRDKLVKDDDYCKNETAEADEIGMLIGPIP